MAERHAIPIQRCAAAMLHLLDDEYRGHFRYRTARAQRLTRIAADIIRRKKKRLHADIEQ